MNEFEAADLAWPIEPTCMMCSKLCEITEILHTGEQWEIWAYCKKCKIDTFHPIEFCNL